jgi:hypothetical protein
MLLRVSGRDERSRWRVAESIPLFRCNALGRLNSSRGYHHFDGVLDPISGISQCGRQIREVECVV